MNTIAKVALIAVVVSSCGACRCNRIPVEQRDKANCRAKVAMVKKGPRIRRSVCGTERLRAGGRQICLS